MRIYNYSYFIDYKAIKDLIDYEAIKDLRDFPWTLNNRYNKKLAEELCRSYILRNSPTKINDWTKESEVLSELANKTLETIKNLVK